MNISGYEVSAFIADNFALDGGAMFGAVPKVLWEKKIKADERNRIPLTCRLLVLKGHSRLILVDVGCGRKWREKERDIYAIKAISKDPVHEVFSEATDLIITHLHFDHGGGATYLDGNNNVKLGFPNSDIYVNKAQWKHSRKKDVRDSASFMNENIEPLKGAKLNLTTDREEIAPNVTLHQADGHTKGLQWILVGQGKGALAYPSDLIPTAHHIHLPYIMGYDLCAEKTMEEKKAFLEQAVINDWVVVFEHDIDTPAAKVKIDSSGKYAVREIVDLPEYDK